MWFVFAVAVAELVVETVGTAADGVDSLAGVLKKWHTAALEV